ncbi:hypothetical protein PL8927_720197 [Planktothrix serta PCC 8927]|uniref:Uncharacterized protein n=1 Tax=Planktothrix serta PCC 8927 TaxID=671068 RepID=A0A7Z9E1S8_9CYAN|nr:hypothetical protein [Planktothrix serta]VXD21790.1 hypothetical protein PL8927_720197 [Planktothrix serta PCC 8927]
MCVVHISQYVKLPTLVGITLGSRLAAYLLPLWEVEQPIISLVKRWQQIQPVDPVTLELINPQIAFEQVKEVLKTIDTFLYMLLEHSGSS